MTTDKIFELRILHHHWIKNEGDDPADLCSHGTVFLKIGSEIICDENTFDVTTSAAAIHLMRTLKEDYTPGKYAGQLLPCCGFFITFGENPDQVDIHGCPNGIDWNIIHLDSGYVKHETKNGTIVVMPYDDYKHQVLAFADSVEEFYKSCSPKILPDDEFEHDAYMAFWDEWHSMRQEWV